MTQFTWQPDECETCGKFPALTDPDAEVYTVAELIARHEKGLLTNLNIGKHAAYPAQAHFFDRDLEKDLNLDPTDRAHLADELDNSLAPVRKAQKEAEEKKKAEEEAKRLADEEARIQAEVEKRISAKKGEEGKT